MLGDLEFWIFVAAVLGGYTLGGLVIAGGVWLQKRRMASLDEVFLQSMAGALGGGIAYGLQTSVWALRRLEACVLDCPSDIWFVIGHYRLIGWMSLVLVFVLLTSVVQQILQGRRKAVAPK